MSKPTEGQPFQFTLAKLFGLVALCSPVMLVSRAEWNSSFPLLTICTLYAVSLAVNVLFLGNIFASIPEFLLGSAALFVAGFSGYCLCLLMVMFVVALTGLKFSGHVADVMYSLFIWIGAILGVMAGNWMLVSQRRWLKDLESRGDFSHRKVKDDDPTAAP